MFPAFWPLNNWILHVIEKDVPPEFSYGTFNSAVGIPFDSFINAKSG
jgi:hypothetical protein